MSDVDYQNADCQSSNNAADETLPVFGASSRTPELQKRLGRFGIWFEADALLNGHYRVWIPDGDGHRPAVTCDAGDGTSWTNIQLWRLLEDVEGAGFDGCSEAMLDDDV